MHIAYLMAAMVIVGSSVTAGKIITDSAPIYLASLIRVVIGTAFLFAILKWKEGRIPAIGRRDVFIMLVQGLAGSFGFNVLILTGMKLTSAVSAGIIAGTTPCILAVFAMALLRERPGLRMAGAILVASVGVISINIAGVTGGGAASVIGNLFVLGAVACEALFLLLRRTLTPSVSTLAASAYVGLAGVFWFLPMGLFELASFGMGGITPAAYAAIVYNGVMATGIAYILWFGGIRHADVSIAASITGLMPVSAVATSALVLGESVLPGHVIGMVMVLGAVVIGGSKKKRRTGDADAPLSVQRVGKS